MFTKARHLPTSRARSIQSTPTSPNDLIKIHFNNIRPSTSRQNTRNCMSSLYQCVISISMCHLCINVSSLYQCVISVSVCHLCISVSSLYQCVISVSVCHLYISVSSLYQCVISQCLLRCRNVTARTAVHS